MMNKKGKGEGKGVSNTGILFAKNIGKAAFIFLLLLIATTFVVSAESVSVESECCDLNQTEGWLYFTAIPDWIYYTPNTSLFQLKIDGEVFDAYCVNITKPLSPGESFNALIDPAEPTCKNNSIGYILNNWTHSCAQCDNVSAAQSAIWYFWYLNESFCSLKPKPLPYNHTALPNQTGWESNWIPNCTAHPEACTFINASINKSVPYAISITPISGTFPAGTPIELEATVDYCAGEGSGEVTVIFKADTCIFNESKSKVYANSTINGTLNATLICDASVNSVIVTARVKDMKWFKIVEPSDVYHQETFGIVNITAEDAQFSFYTHEVPALSLPSKIFLTVMMSIIVILTVRKRGKK